MLINLWQDVDVSKCRGTLDTFRTLGRVGKRFLDSVLQIYAKNDVAIVRY